MGAHVITKNVLLQWQRWGFPLGFAILLFLSHSGVSAQDVPSFTTDELNFDEPLETPLDDSSSEVQPKEPFIAPRDESNASPSRELNIVPSEPPDEISSDVPDEGLSDESVEMPPSPSLRIESILVEGNTVFGSDVIQQKIAPLLPHEIQEPGLAGLESFAKAITDLYHEKGYILAEAYLPEQEIQGGVLKIAVMEGALGKLAVTGNTLYPTSFIERHFKEGQVVSYPAFERSLLLLNEYEDLIATGIFKTGETPGSADFAVSVKDQKPLHYTFDYNNFGSSFISRHRFGVGLTVGNFVQYGDRMSLYGIVGSPISDMNYERIDYGMPIRANGTRLNFQYANGDSDIGKSLADLQITMKTKGWEISAKHPFIKSRIANLTGEIGLEGYDFRRSFGSVSLKRTDRTRLLHMDADYNKWSEGGHQNSARISIRQGLGEILGAMPDNDPEASREGADNGFTKSVFEVRRLQRFTDLISLMMRGTAQIGSDTLVVGEQFSLGGPNSVRGYSIGEFLSDNGYAVNLEMQVFPLEQKELLQAVFFVDQGEGSLKHAPAGGAKRASLTGAGFGVRIHYDYGIKTGEQERPLGMDVMADVGYPLKSGPTTKVGAAYYIQAVWRY